MVTTEHHNTICTPLTPFPPYPKHYLLVYHRLLGNGTALFKGSGLGNACIFPFEVSVNTRLVVEDSVSTNFMTDFSPIAYQTPHYRNCLI